MSVERDDRPVAIVTGGGSGIGRATAALLGKRGDHVVAIDLSREGAEETVRRVRSDGGSAEARVADVTDMGAIQALVDEIAARRGRIDYLFSNAGVPFRAPLAEMPLEGWERVIQTHVTGGFVCCRSILPHMVARRSGAIVLTSSDFAVIGMRNAANYAAAKAALYGLTKSLALEFASTGIRVNAIGPGPIDTPFLASGRTEAEWKDAVDTLLRGVPMGRLGRPEEVASVVAFLLSDRAAYLTGQLVQPNGGQVMW